MPPEQLRCTAAQYGYFLTRKTLVSRVKNSHTFGSFVIFVRCTAHKRRYDLRALHQVPHLLLSHFAHLGKTCFFQRGTSHVRKKLRFEAPVEFCSKTLTSQSSSCKNVENTIFSTFSHIRMHFRSCKR